MGLKKKLGVSVIATALGLSLLVGGSYAFFSDSEDAYANSATELY